MKHKRVQQKKYLIKLLFTSINEIIAITNTPNLSKKKEILKELRLKLIIKLLNIK